MKLFSCCPFCDAPKRYDIDFTKRRVYTCGTVADPTTGVYDRRCGRIK